MEEKIILLIGRNRKNLELLTRFLSSQGYSTVQADDYGSLDEILKSDEKIGLSLIDIAGFDSRIWERCEIMRNKGISFMVISPRQSARIREASVKHGADGMLVKPLALKEFLTLIDDMMKE